MTPSPPCNPKDFERGPAFTLLAIIQATLIFTITLIAVPLPLIASDFGLEIADLLVLQIAYGLPYSGLLLLGGNLTDRFGSTPVLRTGLWIFGIASLGSALTPFFELLVAMRGLQGVDAAMVAPAALAQVAGLFPRADDFERAIARWGGISVLGAAAGTVLSGVITTWVSWRWMFLVPGSVSAIALLMTQRVLPSLTRRHRDQPLDLPGALLVLLGLSAGGYGLAIGGETGWTSSLVLVALLSGAASLVSFIWHERRIASPLLPIDFMCNKERVVGALGIFLAAASMGLVTFILALYLQGEPAWSPLETAGAMTPFLAILVLGGAPSGYLVTRLGAWHAMVLGLLLAATGLWSLSGFSQNYLFDILPGLLLLPAGTSLTFAASAVLMTKGVPPARMGLAGGVMNTAMELGPTAGLAAFMTLTALRADIEAGWMLVFLAASTAFLLLSLGALLIVGRTVTGAQK
ncbi:MFS transporter [Halomonas sp. HMF6819]|uniref:MFS transporter n=1 Tax=Halomonas sp. HMF6819 TaxID=3373085 RepID=UPI003789FE93